MKMIWCIFKPKTATLLTTVLSIFLAKVSHLTLQRNNYFWNYIKWKIFYTQVLWNSICQYKALKVSTTVHVVGVWVSPSTFSYHCHHPPALQFGDGHLQVFPWGALELPWKHVHDCAMSKHSLTYSHLGYTASDLICTSAGHHKT